MALGGGRSSGLELVGQRPGEPMEDEPERVELGDGRLDREGPRQALRRLPWPERVDLDAVGPVVEQLALGTEPGDERRARQLADCSDLAQPEPSQAVADVLVLTEQRGRQGGEERGVLTGLDDP